MVKYKSKIKLIATVLVVIVLVILFFTTDLNKTINKMYLEFFTVTSTISSKDGLYVHFIDVDCADSILITDNDKNVLVDTGNESLRSKSVEYLKDNAITNLDLLILTHYDKDHVGSAVDIMNEIKVDRIIVPVGFTDESEDNELLFEIIDTANSLDIPFDEISAYQNINIGNYTLEIISPLIEYENSNDNSIVSRLIYKDTSFLLTGDIAKSEIDILNTYADISADVIKVAHHGSKSSSNEEFISAVDAKYAVISVGENYYGLPSYAVIDSFEQLGAKVLRTDESGSIVFYSDGSNLEYNTQY